jgi:hypothetical protein
MGTTLISKIAMILLHPENLSFRILNRILKNYHQLNELSTVLKSGNKNIFIWRGMEYNDSNQP